MQTVAYGLPLTINATILNHSYNFLIDTGASISLIPFNTSLPTLRPTGISLQTASQSKIECYGELDVNIALPKLRRTFNWSFVVAKVSQPILGIDFLSHYGLIIDCKLRQLIDTETNRKVSLPSSDSESFSFSISFDNIDPRARSLISSFPNLTAPLNLSASETPSNGVYHTIDTGDNPPVYSKPRPLTGNKLSIAKAEFQFLLDTGRIRRSNSPWATPLHMVPKKEAGTFRPCGDYRRLNSITVSDKYPLPNLRNLTMSLHNKIVFSKIDLQRAYLQIPVAPNDIPKTAVTTPFGLFEFLYTPYGLRNAGSTFQRFMDSILSNVKNVYGYLDDILIASESEEEHLSDLNNVLSILSKHNLRITPKKCDFFKTSLTFLGYHVSKDGIRPPDDRVEVITKFSLPQNSTELRRFMGMLNFFRHMIPDFANIAFPITELLRLNPKSHTLTWSDTEKDSFNKLKQSLTECPTLNFPSPDTSIYHLVTDSSQYAAGAALYQLVDGKPCPVSFFSKKYSINQRALSTYDRELLAAFLSVLHFKTLIDGHTVFLFTDHKPLVSAFHSKSTPKSDRQQRQLSLISEYVSDVHFISGRENVVADFLSRPISAVSTDVFDLTGIAEAQKNDTEVIEYKDRLSPYPLPNNLTLLCDTSTQTPRPFVPSNLRTNIISFMHNLSHPSAKTTIRLIKDRYFWPSMDHSIKEYVHTCLSCQSAKVGKHTHSPISPISSPTDRFQAIHIDIVGPLPLAYLPSQTEPLPYRYLLTCIDRATRWTEAIPLVDTTATSVAIALISGWISRFGVPLTCVTDRGSQFESELFSELSSLIGFHHIRTTSYNPKANGIIERFHRTLKSAIMARKTNWLLALPIVLLGYRMSPNSSNFSPFTAVTGSHMLTPYPMISQESSILSNNDTLQKFISEMQSLDFYQFSPGDCHSVPPTYIPKDLFSAPKVWLRIDRVRRPLEAPYSGPFEVLKRADKYFILQLPQGETSVSIDRLKPAYLPPPPIPIKHKVQTPKNSSPPIVTPSSTPDSLPPNVQPPLSAQTPIKAPVTTRYGRNVKFNLKPDYKYIF